MSGLDTHWLTSRAGAASFHVAGSAYSTGLFRSHEQLAREILSQPSPEKQISTIPDVVVKECTALFFAWQYPYCTIIDRNAFMADYSCSNSSPSYGGNRCSPAPALLYAVCALGALMSHDHSIRQLADLFSAAADDALLFSWTTLLQPRLTISQAMLIWAVFETGRGNASKARTYLGMSGLSLHTNGFEANLMISLDTALRMAQSLGIHEDGSPQPFSDDTQSALFVDLESRRRTSLTYAISDKFPLVGLKRGRPR